MKNLKAKVLTAGLTAAMVLSMGAPVFAADTTKVVTGGSDATIEKDLSIAKKGVTSPKATYTFTFSAVTKDAPSISAKTANTTKDSTQTGDGSGIISVKTGALLNEADKNALIVKGPGIYEYNVTESTDFTGDEDHVLTVDSAIYRIKIKVAYSDNTLAVTGITAQKVSSAEATSSDNDTDKVQAITFNNKYTEYANDDPEKPEDPDNPKGGESSKGLVISKTIGTTGGEDKDAKFTYTIKFTKDNVNGDNKITAGTAVKDGENSVTDLSYDKDYTFELGNGGSINFKVPAGTEYTVTETTDGYTAKYVTTTNGITATEATGSSVSSYVGEKSNSVAFTNTKDSSPLTGIVNNYGGLIAVVAIAAGGMIVLTLRRRQDA